LIRARTDLHRKAAREEMARELRAEYVKLFGELKLTFGLKEEGMP